MKKNKFLVLLLILSITILSFGCGKGISESVMEYKGKSFSECDYSYWMSTYKYNFLYSFNSDTESDDFWESNIKDGVTYEQYISDTILYDSECRTAALKLFDDYNLKISESDLEEIDNDINDKIENHGSREEINTKLAKMNLNLDLLRDVYTNNLKYDKVYDYLYGDNGTEAPTADELKSYYEQNCVCVKFITVYSGVELDTDDSGNYLYDDNGKLKYTELTEDEKTVKQKLVDTVIAAIEGGADIDSCVKDYSDIDYSENPNGFILCENDAQNYGSDIIKTAISLDVGKTAKVSDDSLTYIIYKCKLPQYSTLSATDLSTTDIKTYCTNEKYKTFFDKLIKDVSVNEEIIKKYSIRDVSKNAYF